MEQFLKDILASAIAGILVAVIIDRWRNRKH